MSFLADDFDYPMPQRKTNWTLEGESKRKTRLSQNTHTVNRTDDIDGAKAGSTVLYRSKQFVNKPNLYDTKDIDKSTPMRQVPERVNKDNQRNVNNRDIDHSYPESKLFSTPRVVDPLMPSYPLPKVHARLPTPPEMRHETMKISDIEGTSAKPQRLRSQVRDPLDYSDVPLSKAGSTADSRKRKTVGNALVTKDITDPQTSSPHRPRDTNPLEPRYNVFCPPGVDAKNWSIGQVEGSKSKTLPPARKDRPLLSLRSADIDGAKPTNNTPYPKERREWKKTCDVSDIDTRGKRTIH